ncbi:MAG: hypothetical protein EXQ52_05040 [Bryobacterales bacterium]|nr:hypothetical protein [Bryobacterales bacterium]
MIRILRLFTILAAGVFSAQAALIHQYLFNGDVSDSARTSNGSLNGGAAVAGGILTLGVYNAHP